MRSLVSELARPEILALPGREAVAGGSEDFLDDIVRLHLNENPHGSPRGSSGGSVNRYPEPGAPKLRRAMARLYGVPSNNLLVTRGADDAIDILIRSFCRASVDSIAMATPTFGAYALFAKMQGAGIVETRLGRDFRFHPAAFIDAVKDDEAIKLAFLCSPNNPTGNVIPKDDVLKVADALFDRIIIVDEAYVEFAKAESLASEAVKRDNLVVLRTLSKAYGLAGARVGAAIANEELIALIGRALPPFPLPTPSLSIALDALRPTRSIIHEQRVEEIKAERDRLLDELRKAPLVDHVWPSEANFLLLRVTDPALAAEELNRRGVRARWRPDIGPFVLRLSVGTPQENALALAAFGLEAESTSGRAVSLVRETGETKVALSLDLDRPEPRAIDTGIPFYDHMLDQVAAHGGFSLAVQCDGDIEIDAHHSIEDVAIALGSALDQALGARRGIGRFGFALPMDEAEAQVLIDLSGRPYSLFEGSFSASHIGAFPTEMTAHVFRSIADGLRASIHVRVEGANDHHKTESCFKAFGRALRQAIAKDAADDRLPSTKGAL